MTILKKNDMSFINGSPFLIKIYNIYCWTTGSKRKIDTAEKVRLVIYRDTNVSDVILYESCPTFWDVTSLLMRQS